MFCTSGIELDGSNKTLWSSMRSAEEAREADKKQRFAAAALEREVEARRLREKSEAMKNKAAEKEAKEKAKAPSEDDVLNSFFASVAPIPAPPPAQTVAPTPPSPSPPPADIPKTSNPLPSVATAAANATADSAADSGNGSSNDVSETAPVATPAVEEEGDLLASFFSDLSEADKKKEQQAEAAANEQQQSLLTEKYTNQDLGSGKAQYERLTATNYIWKNQNPYRVMQLDIDATEEDIKYR